MAFASHAGAYADLGSRSIIGSFYRTYEEVLGDIWATKVGWLNPLANQETETYRMLGASPYFREWKGGRNLDKNQLYSFTIDNKVFEATLSVGTDDLRRDKTGQIMARIGDLAKQTGEHWNELVSTLLENNDASYTGSNMFASHTIGDATVDNDLVAGDLSALNVTTAAEPTQTEMADIITGMIGKLYGFQNERQKPVNGSARNFIFLVHPKMMASAFGAVQSERLNSGNSNIFKAFESAGGINVEVVANPYFTEANNFVYLLRTDATIKPVILQEEEGVKVEVVGAGSEHEFKHREQLFGVCGIRNVGPGEVLYAARGTLS